ncbi:MAG: MoxR family ATPase [Desulfobulbaceae bacterium]
MKEKMFSVAETFGINVPKEIMVKGFEDEGSPFVPEDNPHYIFRTDLLSDILAWFMGAETLGDGLFLGGPTGCGKSTLLLQICARLNIPVQRVIGHARLEVECLLGQLTLVDGDMIWMDGPLTTAARYGHLFLLDEQDLVDPGQLAGLNAVLEGSPLTLPGNAGEVVKLHKNFRFAATGNSNGAGDETGLYQGVLRQNLAFMDRFTVVKVGYPEPQVEAEILAKQAHHLPDLIREKMIELANEVRKLFTSPEGLDVTFSTRTLLRWAFLLSLARNKPEPLVYSLDRALGNRASEATQEALRELVHRVFGEGMKV